MQWSLSDHRGVYLWKRIIWSFEDKWPDEGLFCSLVLIVALLVLWKEMYLDVRRSASRDLSRAQHDLMYIDCVGT